MSYTTWLQPPILSRSTATVLGTLGVIMGTRSLLNPTAFSVDHGVLQNPWKSARNPYIRMTGSYMVASSIGMLALVYFREDRALGLHMLQTIFTGAVDGWITLSVLDQGPAEKAEESALSTTQVDYVKKSAYIHWGISAFGGAMGAWLLSEVW